MAMEDYQRGRLPSAAKQNHTGRTPSPSPHGAFQPQPQPLPTSTSSLRFDQPLALNSIPFGDSYNDTLSSNSQSPFDPNDLLNTSQAQQNAFEAQCDNIFFSVQSLSHGGHQNPTLNQAGDLRFASDDYLSPNDNSNLCFGHDAQLFDGTEFLDPQLLCSDQLQDQSIDPHHLMNDIATHQHSPTPPHMLQPGMNGRPGGNSPHVSPNLAQGQWTPSHSRNTSLDPASAAFPQRMISGWGEGLQFRGHTRSPSDAHSDVSSNFNSPYLESTDRFDTIDHHSPLLGAQTDPSSFHGMGMENFTINDNHQPQQQHINPSHISPLHSPHISPRLLPQQHQLPAFTSDNPFGGMGVSTLPIQFGGMNQGGPMFSDNEAFPSMANGVDLGQARSMSPPEINIQPPAPPLRQASFEAPKPEDVEDSLSPPDRRRPRAVSDPYAGGARAPSPAHGNGGRMPHIRNSLSPNSARAISRSPSPSRGGPGNRRSSTSNIPNRDYLLDLADPTRPASAMSDSPSTGRQRTQKHPATFQCNVCPKRFTRAYNLRSHHRTHTDERPFECKVCGKAFARQHDRKRHEGLHSGERRFVCRGSLKEGDSWGCGRKFARADALGRHFRSEAGRVCIKPLLEEEAAEKGGLEQVMGQQQMPPGGVPGIVEPAGMVAGMPMQMGMEGGMLRAQSSMVYPQRLFQQFPMLASMWDQLPSGGKDDVDEIGGFDASSGGDVEDYDDPGKYGGGAMGWARDSGVY